MRHDDDSRLSEVNGDVVTGGNLQESQEAFGWTIGRSIRHERNGILIVRLCRLEILKAT